MDLEKFEVDLGDEFGTPEEDVTGGLANPLAAFGDQETFEVELDDDEYSHEDSKEDEEQADAEDASEVKNTEGAQKPEKAKKTKGTQKANAPSVEEEVKMLEYMTDVTGFEISPEDLEKHGDVKSAIEAKKFEYAETVFRSVLDTLGTEEQEAITRMIQGAKLEDFMGKTVTTPKYTEEDIYDRPEVRTELIKSALKAKGRTDKEIDRYIKGMDEDEAIDEAKDALNELKKHALSAEDEIKNKAAARKRAYEDAQRKQVEAINRGMDDLLKDTSKFIPNVKLHQNSKEAIKASVLTNVNEIFRDLEKYAPRLAVLKHIGVLDGDFSRITNAAVTKANKSLEEALRNKRTSTSSSATENTYRSSEDDDFKYPTPLLRKR